MVCIALLTLVPGELGGSETYTRELLRALAHDGTLPYHVYLPPVAPDAGEGLPSTVLLSYPRARSLRERLAAMTRAAARPGTLRTALEGADVVHFPFTLRVPPVPQPSVVTLHDVQHLDLPELFGRGERAFRAFAWHRSVRGADRVIVPTAFVRASAVRHLGIDEARIRVIHHGIDHARFTPGGPSDDIEQREPFLLYPARRWPHKNHARLLEAFAVLRRERPGLRLVLTGGGHPAHGAPDGVEVRGHVPADELVRLLRRASALVFPSLYEGFGQPPLEAMACGTPVACSDAGALPEVVGEAARLFDPRSVEELAAAMRDVLDDPEPWRARGLERARAFTWKRSAAAHEAVYRELSTRS